MVLGFAKAIKNLGFNPQKIVFFECNDIDPLCVNMSYIQLALNGLKAVVTRGSGLNGEVIDRHITPAILKSEEFETFPMRVERSGNKIEQMKIF